MVDKYIPGRYIQREIDEIIELVRDRSKFEPVRVREVQEHIQKILIQHEAEILARLEENQDQKASENSNDIF
ncbi:TPA: hypothetical protein TUM56_000255 [Streptococcus equi subsp. zooepidemicus]|uniref:Uncharacterized protein n=2 Tax=Streptococcus equi TaxID=1336 RepID=A0A6M1L2Z0_9STRE|nr:MULTISPECIES: hypothetical protein [Streptococcus]KIS13253.1 hypothetical protein AT50_00356 [Streptococcus equi subsp. zooepidemicus Sz105]QBX15598.1 hypothetical protein Javan197_0012 [Streptococcus phage Javan197]QBX24494.1 hypothetical protein Javan190_0012 [Streptococcus phage Javan190]QBX24548.1 hypothetical protein Javan192_0012 [Streptococcus phage Javan192]ASB97391.1 hypothetical protein SE071780_01804 [Streptococcus equi subsp. equi]